MQHPLINIAIKAAHRAGNVILRHIDRLDRIRVERKARNDFVSDIDRMAEAEIVRTIREAFPDHGILAEESGHQPGDEHEWIIDPLDGTTNFLHGYTHFAVSIAMRRRGVLEQGVIFDPVRNEMFTASRGRGAAVNNRRIRVSRTTRLEDALLGTGFPFRMVDNIDRYLREMRTMMIRTSGVRRAGSAALDLAHVACGRFDGFWERGLNAWDMAAGVLLITEAGGLVTDLSGGQQFLDNGEIVAANEHLLGPIIDTLQRCA